MDESDTESSSDDEGRDGVVREGKVGLKGGVKGGFVGKYRGPSSSASEAKQASSSASSSPIPPPLEAEPDANAIVVATCYNNRGACHFMLRNFRAAADDCARAVALHPRYIKAHLRRARSLVELGDFSPAAQHLAKAHRLQPSRDLLAEHQKTVSVAQRLEDGIGACRREDWSTARKVLGDLLRDTNAVGSFLPPFRRVRRASASSPLTSPATCRASRRPAARPTALHRYSLRPPLTTPATWPWKYESFSEITSTPQKIWSSSAKNSLILRSQKIKWLGVMNLKKSVRRSHFCQ